MDNDRIEPQGELKLLITNQISQQISDRFPVNSSFQKLAVRDNVKIRQNLANSHLTGVVQLEQRSYYPLSFGSVNTTLEITDSELHQQLCDEFDTVYDRADELDLKVPPWGELLTELAEATSSETAQEFETLVEAATPDDLDSLDEVALALVAAARTKALQYDISKWGEEMNIGSKATFSRRKSTLENEGIITTEPVQVDVGRPRDRLLIAKNNSKRRSESACPCSSSTEDTVDRVRSEDDSRDPNPTDSDPQQLDDILDEELCDVLLDDDS